jgi:polyphosphate kinase 2 (PPK2 family)
VLVERVEGLARPKEWQRAYDDINAFEKMLVDDGIRLVKLFLHVSDAEQLRRFHERIATPTKHWKISAKDIRNRAHRRDYLAALDDMFALTSTAAAPWYVVPAECKWFARLSVAKAVVKALGKGLALGPPPLAPEVIKAATAILGRKELDALGLTEPARAKD